MLAVNNGNNPMVDAKHPTKYSKVIHQAGYCCVTARTRRGGLRDPPGGAARLAAWRQGATRICLRRCAKSPRSAGLRHDTRIVAGVCFGKAAIIRPRAPPRNDMLSKKRHLFSLSLATAELGPKQHNYILERTRRYNSKVNAPKLTEVMNATMGNEHRRR